MANSSNFQDIQKFFTKHEWDNLCDYERQRYSNIKRNYDEMQALGLNPKLPELFSRRKKQQVVDSESEEEWTPKLEQKFQRQKHSRNKCNCGKKKQVQERTEVLLNNVEERQMSSDKPKLPQPVLEGFPDAALKQSKCLMEILLGLLGKMKLDTESKKEPTNVKKATDSDEKHKAVVSSISSRYPKRNISRRPCYKEDNISDDDNCYYCSDCEMEHEDSCPINGPFIRIKDSPTPDDGSDPNRAEHSLPVGLSLWKSGIRGAGMGVWADKAFPKGVLFGPYEGVILPPSSAEKARKSGYSWQIFKNSRTSHFIDASDTSQSNWLRYVNCACTEGQQNLVAFQYHGEIYYRTYKPVYANSELLVWYGDDYGRELGIQEDPNADKEQAQNKGLQKGFDCWHCGKFRFTNEEALENHIRWKHAAYISNGEVRKHQCTRCHYSTNFSCSMISHIRTHTGDKPYECNTCGKRFSEKPGLIYHKRIHTGEKPYLCTLCEKAFRSSSNLASHHKRRHLKQKYFECKQCGKTFSVSADLNRHVRNVHLGLRSYQCQYCMQRFKGQSNLRIHVICKHSRKYPYRCKQCMKGFVTSCLLKKHIEKSHPNHMTNNDLIMWVEE